jgi:hypothetical protein
VRPGRNDPCPCGSGKKYKKCCLPSEVRAAQPPLDSGNGAAAVREAAVAAVARYAMRPEFEAARVEAQRLFEPPADADEDLVDDVHLKAAFYHFFDYPLPGGRSIAETFLEREGYRLADKQARALRTMAATRMRPYQVEDVVLDEGLALRDLLDGQQVFVGERSGTRQVTRWDVLGARVAPDLGGTPRFEGALYVFPARAKAALVDALRRERAGVRRRHPGMGEDHLLRLASPLFHRFWLDHVVSPPLPRVVTAEGDIMELGRLVFDVVDADAVRAALAAHPAIHEDEPGHYTWFEEAGDDFTRALGRIALSDDELVLEVASRQRAQRGRRLLREAASDALRHRSTRYESVENALAKRRASPRQEDQPGIPADVAADLMRQFKGRHYATWPDEPLPGLDGRTPRQAARLKTLRPRLIDMLQDMENSEARGARPDNPPYDFGWIWRELGLEGPK